MNTTPTNNIPTFRILFLVYGILNLIFSFIPLIYVFIGAFVTTGHEFSHGRDEMPFNPGMIFIVIGLIGFIFVITLGVLNLLTSKYLNETRNYNFIFVMAIINCFSGILGIALGVFTLIELSKPYAKMLFGMNSKVPASPDSDSGN